MEGEIPLFYMNSTEFIPFTVININPTAEYGIGEVTGVYLFVKKVYSQDLCISMSLQLTKRQVNNNNDDDNNNNNN